MEVYQWLLRRNDFKVSATGYFVYVNGNKDAPAFDKKLEFDVTILPCVGDDGWVEKTLFKIKEALDGETMPERGTDCEYCDYREAVQEVLPKPKKAKTKKTESVSTLF